MGNLGTLIGSQVSEIHNRFDLKLNIAKDYIHTHSCIQIHTPPP